MDHVEAVALIEDRGTDGSWFLVGTVELSGLPMFFLNLMVARDPGIPEDTSPITQKVVNNLGEHHRKDLDVWVTPEELTTAHNDAAEQLNNNLERLFALLKRGVELGIDQRIIFVFHRS